jgi:uncharacterized protein
MRGIRSGTLALALCLAGIMLVAAMVWLVALSLIWPHRTVMGEPPRDLPLEEVTISSVSGATLHGWYASGCTGQGAVLLLHGVRADRLAMLPRARWLHRLGYGVLLIDFQASGESSGRWITLGARESDDAVASLAYLRSRSPGERTAVIGTSMGGAAALLARPPLPVDAMVLEQVYPDIDQAVRDRLQLHLGGARWLAPWMLKLFTWQTGVSPDTLRPIDHIHDITVPKLLVVGSDDRHTRLSESLAMYAAATTPKELWIVNGAQHVDLYRFDTAGYQQHVAAFLSRWLRDSTPEIESMQRCAVNDKAPASQPQGNVITACNPPPSRLASFRLPPMEAMSCAPMASPRPEPPVSRLRDDSSR